MGVKATVPSHSPLAESTSPLGKQQVITDTKRQVRGIWPRMFSSSRRTRPGSSSPGPPYRAEYTPGAPLRASTHSPESSAMAGRPLASMTALAFSREFSSKVVPVSSTSTSTPASASEQTSTPRWDRISFISASFFLFLLASTSFIVTTPTGPCPFVCSTFYPLFAPSSAPASSLGSFLYQT